MKDKQEHRTTYSKIQLSIWKIAIQMPISNRRSTYLPHVSCRFVFAQSTRLLPISVHGISSADFVATDITFTRFPVSPFQM